MSEKVDDYIVYAWRVIVVYSAYMHPCAEVSLGNIQTDQNISPMILHLEDVQKICRGYSH